MKNRRLAVISLRIVKTSFPGLLGNFSLPIPSLNIIITPYSGIILCLFLLLR